MTWVLGITAMAAFLGLALNDARRFEIEYGLLMAACGAMVPVNIALGVGPGAMFAGAAVFFALVWIVTRRTRAAMGQGDWVFIPCVGALLGLANLTLFYAGFGLILAMIIGRQIWRGLNWRRAPVPAALPIGLAMIPVIATRLWHTPPIEPSLTVILALIAVMIGLGWTLWDVKLRPSRKEDIA